MTDSEQRIADIEKKLDEADELRRSDVVTDDVRWLIAELRRARSSDSGTGPQTISIDSAYEAIHFREDELWLPFVLDAESRDAINRLRPHSQSVVETELTSAAPPSREQTP